MLQAARSLMVSKAAQAYVNNLIARYGVVRNLRIDPKARTIEGECLLHGEREPISVRVDRYQILEKGGKRLASLLHCQCSRPWAQALIEDHIIGRQVELPAWAAGAL